jgi:hypothetical protein
MCKDCLANRGDVNWADFRMGSHWMRTLWTLERWLQHYHGHQSVYEMPGVNVFTLLWDSLHVNEKGTAGQILGSTLHVIVIRNPSGKLTGPLQKRMQTIAAEVNAELDRLEVPSNMRAETLEVDMFAPDPAYNPKEYPCLSGHGIKAAQIRYLVKCVFNVAKRYSDGSDDYNLLLGSLEGLDGFYDIINVRQMFLEPHESARLIEHVHKSCLCYAALAKRGADAGTKLYNLTPKFHYWMHMAWFAKFENPRQSWTYANEDYVGRIAKVAKSIAFGTNSLNLGRKVLLKFLRALHIRYRRRKMRW